MPNKTDRVLVINPGSTSTKIAIYTAAGVEMVRTIRHGTSDLERFRGYPVMSQLGYRTELIERELDLAGYIQAGQINPAPAAVAGRGGFLPPSPCGTYVVEDFMLDELRSAKYGEHAANLGAGLAYHFACAAGVKAYVVDPVTVDEWQDCARITGSPLLERSCVGHALNTKAVAKRFAREQGKRYEDLRLIVAHMGSGMTVSAHLGGRTIDSNTIEEGPFGPDRTGSLPTRALIKLCFSGRFTEKELDRMAFGDGGLFAYLGTRDLMEVEHRIDAGDEEAARIFEAMVYQVTKEAGSMAAVLEGKVDALLLTGGMAYSKRVVALIREKLSWIAPLHVYPGEEEMQSLAEGVFRVLNGEEGAKRVVAAGRRA